jgi:hypothetical protein
LATPPEIGAIRKLDTVPQPAAPSATGEGMAFFRAGRYAEALLAWQHAAVEGSANAALFVGMMYDAGQGVPQSYADALSWYQLAADKGSTEAAFNIGVMHEAGFGVRPDTAEAADWYQRAAAKGSGRAAYNLALLYENGDGVPQDADQAGKYFRQARRLGVTATRSHGHRSDQDDDADMSFNTLHVIESDAPRGGSAKAAAAADRIQRLADQGDPAAQYDLGYYLEKGIGVEMNLYGAYAMYLQAAAVTDDFRLKTVAESGAGAVKAHLAAAKPRS